MYRTSKLAVFVSLLLAAPLQAGTEDMTRLLEDPARSEADRALDQSRMPAEVIAFADIDDGDVIADFMAGGGYFTQLLAAQTGKAGLVYAVNPAGFHNIDIWSGLTAKYPNIRTMPVPPRSMLLAPDSVDSIFAHLVFHDLYWESAEYKFPALDVDNVLANWFSALRPGGSVMIVDHAGPGGDTRAVTKELHRIDPATVEAAMIRAGFAVVAKSNVLQRSEDNHELNVFDPRIRGKTDRFMMKFAKPS